MLVATHGCMAQPRTNARSLDPTGLPANAYRIFIRSVVDEPDVDTRWTGPDPGQARTPACHCPRRMRFNTGASLRLLLSESQLGDGIGSTYFATPGRIVRTQQLTSL